MKAVNKEKKSEVKGTLTANNCLEVQQAIQKMLQTSTSLKGKYVKVLLGNLELIDPALTPVMTRQNELVEKYTVKGEDGQPVKNSDNTGFEFKNDDDDQKFQSETKDNWTAPIEAIKFFTMSMSDFDEMPIDTSKNDTMYLILKYLVNPS